MRIAVESGSRHPRRPVADPGNPNPPGSGSGGASHPGKNPGKGKGKNSNAGSSIEPLNPPFDPRMRRVGSPLNMSHKIKRGWIQDKDATKRVNFLFNPSQLDVQHAVDPQWTESPLQQEGTNDVTSPFYTGSGSQLSVKLLYDRTYELFSAPKDPKFKSTANLFGVWADVAAWYTYVGLLDDMPTTWDEGLIINAAQLIPSYLFIGPRLAYYGWPTSVNVTYSHWSQNMVPSRCAVDVGFQILPHQGTALSTISGWSSTSDMLFGDAGAFDWLGDLTLSGATNPSSGGGVDDPYGTDLGELGAQ
jgi:hypothetical protein